MAGRANHYLYRSGARAASWGIALFAAVAVACAGSASLAAGDAGVTQPAAAEPFPVASDVRLAGDSQQTRFVLDLDRKIDLRAFVLDNPARVVVDVPQVTFKLPDGVGRSGRGLVKAFRYGLVMPGGSRLVFDLSGPAKIEKAYVLDAANGQPPRLVVELAATDSAAWAELVKSSGNGTTSELRPSLPPATVAADVGPTERAVAVEPADKRPVVVIDPGHGGLDNGTQAASGETEKAIVLAFGLALRDRLAENGKYRVVLTRDDDTFIPLGDRVKIARGQNAALFVSIHADALPRREGDAQGATVYTLSDKASDAEAERLAESENKADAIGGVNLTEEPTEVADILIDLAQRETRTFSNRFASALIGEMKGTMRMHRHPLKSAGFKVLKAPDVPSVLIELGYVSNKDDLKLLVSDSWRSRSVVAVARAIDGFLAKRTVSAGTGTD